jgi:hypothetical protein
MTTRIVSGFCNDNFQIRLCNSWGPIFLSEVTDMSVCITAMVVEW